MADEILPFVEQKDYGALLRIIKRDFPDAFSGWPGTHGEWLELHEQEKSKLFNRHCTVRCIEVDPEEFAEFCRRYKLKGNFQDFLRFAVTIGKDGEEEN